MTITITPAQTSSNSPSDTADFPSTGSSESNASLTSGSPESTTLTTTLQSTGQGPQAGNSAVTGSTQLPTTSLSPTLSTSPASISSNTTTIDNPGLATGAVAGIAIGTFIAGVVLALACACVFMMLQKKKHRSHGSSGRQRSYRDSEYSQERGTSMKQMTSSVSPVGAAPDTNLNRVLLEPVSSSEVKIDMLAIGSQIIQHVDNNYHLKPVDNLPASFTENLTQAGYSAFTGVSIEQLGILLRNMQTRRAATRHLISFFIFSKILSTCDIETSLLPRHIISFLKKMPPPERTSGSREAYDIALTKWRLLSAYLLQNVRSNRDPLLPEDSDIQPAIARNINTVRQILALFVVPGAEKRQAENLQGLMVEGAKFGLTLFQQPESWVVDWQSSRGEDADQKTRVSGRVSSATIVLFPGLTKVLDEEGKRHAKTNIVLAVETLQI